MRLGLRNREIAKMKDGGRQHRGRTAFRDAIDEVIQRANAARCNHRDGHSIRDGARQRQVKARARAVAIHGCEQDLARAFLRHALGKFHRVNAGRFAAAMGENLPFAWADGFGVDGHHNALAAKARGRLSHHVWVGHRRGIEADLVGTCQKKVADIFMGAHAAPNGEGNVTGLGGATHNVKHRATVFMGGMDVKKAEFIGTGGVIGPCGIHGVTRVAQIDKVYPFDDAPIGNVQAGYDPGFEHLCAVRAAVLQWSRGFLWANGATCQRMVAKISVKGGPNMFRIGAILAVIAFALPGWAKNDDLIKVQASGDVAATMDALEAAVTGAGATVFARVDHAGGAEKVGLDLAPSQLLIFGNPKLGTPAMQDDPMAGLFLPLKVLVYRDGAGQVWLAYEDPRAMFEDLGGIGQDAKYLDMMTGALAKLTGKAAGS